MKEPPQVYYPNIDFDEFIMPEEYWREISIDHKNAWFIDQFEHCYMPYNNFVLKMRNFEFNNYEHFLHYAYDTLTTYYTERKAKIVLNEIQIMYLLGYCIYLKKDSELYKVFF